MHVLLAQEAAGGRYVIHTASSSILVVFMDGFINCTTTSRSMISPTMGIVSA